MVEGKAALIGLILAESSRIVEAMLPAAPNVVPDGLLEALPCLRVAHPGPTEEGARAFLAAALAWIGNEDLAAFGEWIENGQGSGFVPFLCTLRRELPRLAADVGGEVEGAPAAEWVTGRLDGFASACSVVADTLFTRGRDCMHLLSSYLEAAHRMGSPLSTVMMQADLATAALDAGRTDSARRHLQEAAMACEALARQRRELSDSTPVWAHALRHLRDAQEESLA